MKRMLSLPLAVLLISTPAVLSAQDKAKDFQTGKIISVEKIDSSAPAGGTDAPTATNKQKHNLSIDVGGTVYVCRAETAADFDLDWAQGKEVPVRIKGKTMHVKRADGKVVKLSILSKTSG